MHHCQIKNFLGRAHGPLPVPLPTREGDTPSPDLTSLSASILMRAFVARRSRSFSFRTRTLGMLNAAHSLGTPFYVVIIYRSFLQLLIVLFTLCVAGNSNAGEK